MQYAKWSGEKAYDEAAAAIHVTPKELKNYRKSLTRGVSLAPREDVELYWWCIQTARGYATQHAEQYGGGAVPRPGHVRKCRREARLLRSERGVERVAESVTTPPDYTGEASRFLLLSLR
jgi:hypothetical protein